MIRITSTLLFRLTFLFMLPKLKSVPGEQFSLNLPLNWSTYCPYTKFCHHNASQQINLTDEQKPCCEECSCEPDCGLRRNCCQYSMDKYRIDEKYRTKCTSLTTSVNDIFLAKKYQVVDTCPDTSNCYDLQAVPWGSMYPVYSQDTNMIYLNDMCATCHNDTNVVEWQIEVNCPSSGSNSYISEGLQYALSGEHSNGIECVFTFFPPSNADIEFQACSDATISKCRVKTVGHVERECEAINATYYQSPVTFANIYCFICYRNEFNVWQTVCKKDNYKRNQNIPLSFLLSTEDLQALLKANNGPEQNEHEGCSMSEIAEKASGLCRKIRCPEGQVLIEWKCKYISEEWYAGPFLTYVRLEPNVGVLFSKTLIEKLRTYKGAFFRSKMKTWSRTLYYFAYNNESYIRYFVLELIHPKATINPKTFFDNYLMSLKPLWTIKVDRKMYYFKARIHTIYQYDWVEVDKNIDYVMSHGSTKYPHRQFINATAYDFEILTLVKNFRFFVHRAHVAVTRIFFCKQVDLKPEEFIDNTFTIFFKVTGRTLEEAEFKRTADIAGNITISICLTEFGNNFWENLSTGNACSLSLSKWNCHFPLVLILFLIFY